jgi:hypothetical protein
MNPPRSGREQALGTTPVKLANTIVDEYDIIDPLDQLVSYSIKLLVADTGRVLLVDPQGTLRVVASLKRDAEFMELRQIGRSHPLPGTGTYETQTPPSPSVLEPRDRTTRSQGTQSRWFSPHPPMASIRAIGGDLYRLLR